MKSQKKSLTIQVILLDSTQQLSPFSSTPRLDVEILLSHVLRKNRSYLYTWPDKFLTTVEYIEFEQLLQRRLQGEPLAYIVGYKEFWSLSLEVNKATLVPRPETELLVELALAHLPLDSQSTVLDLGTGSGAIALAVAKERPYCQVIASDCTLTTLLVAQKNAQTLGISNVYFIASDWLSAFSFGCCEVIIANPPYIAGDDPHLMELQYEPKQALVAGKTGLEAICDIISVSQHYLNHAGWLMLEHGYDQAQAVEDLLLQHGYSHVCNYLDYSGQPRVTIGCSLT